MRAHTLDMTVGSPARLLLRFSLPLFVGNLLQQVYNLADTAIAGHLLGDAALSQIGATAALYSLITTLAFGLNSGFALSVSRHFGANDRKRMEQSVCWMVTLSALCAAVMTAVFLLSRFALADAMQIPADTREGALAYLTVILAGIPLTMAYNLESSLMQSVGQQRHAAAVSGVQQHPQHRARSAVHGAARPRRGRRGGGDGACAGHQRGAWAVLHSPPRT